MNTPQFEKATRQKQYQFTAVCVLCANWVSRWIRLLMLYSLTQGVCSTELASKRQAQGMCTVWAQCIILADHIQSPYVSLTCKKNTQHYHNELTKNVAIVSTPCCQAAMLEVGNCGCTFSNSCATSWLIALALNLPRPAEHSNQWVHERVTAGRQHHT